MTAFSPGDLIISDRYGPGKVTALSGRPGYVLASFGETIDNQYNAETGRRCAVYGSDTIVKREAEHADNL
jgi:hypothetical protein